MRRVAPVLEVLVPLLLLGLWAIWSAGSDTFYYPPLTEILETFSETWLFERVGSDVVPSLLRLTAGYFLAVVIAVLVGIPLGLNATGPPRRSSSSCARSRRRRCCRWRSWSSASATR
jgi:ABC-type nitrate/sulfonate/bicarbonate transport system permease component